MTLTTLRSKAIAAIVVMWLVIFFIKKKIRIRIYFLVLAGILSFWLARDQIYFYFLENDQYARSVLLTTGFEIANTYFPLGTGLVHMLRMHRVYIIPTYTGSFILSRYMDWVRTTYCLYRTVFGLRS